MWTLWKALHIGWREGQAAMNPMLDSFLTDLVSEAWVLSQAVEIFKNKEEKEKEGKLPKSQYV